MKSILLATTTFREAVRDRVFGLVAAFGLLLVLSTVIISPLTVGARGKIVTDIGLASISLFSLLMVLFVGSGMVHKEIDRRTIMTILSKPISRLDYLLGKYLGLWATLFVMMAAMTLIFACACALTEAEWKPTYLVALGMALCEMTVVTAVVVFFSSFTTPVLTSLFTLATFIVGHAIGDLERFAMVTGSAGMERAADISRFVLPNLDLFNVRNAVVHDLPVHSEHVVWAVVYALLYSAVLLAISDLLFRRREFK